MLFSLDYRSKMRDQADEVRCPYNQLGTIFKFIKQHPQKRYIIVIDKEISQQEQEKVVEQVHIIAEVTSNHAISCHNLAQTVFFLNKSLNAFLAIPVSNWETFAYLRDLKVSDIYIDGPLGFQCNSIVQGKENIKIRVSPTVSPVTVLSAQREPNSFFIRPEDLAIYNEMIDVIDFQASNLDMEEALFNIYKRGYFNFNIDQLILRLPYGVNNLAFKDAFAKNRLNCRQKCNIPGRSCHFCEKYFLLISQIQQAVSR